MNRRLTVLVVVSLLLLLASLWWSYRLLAPVASPQQMHQLQAEELRAIAEHTPPSNKPGIYQPPAGFVKPNLDAREGR